MISNCRLLRFGRTQQAYLPRTRDIRDTYGTIAPRKSPLFNPQKFPIIKIRAYCSSRQIEAVNLLFYVRACPHSGDYSGTSLGVRYFALLHSQATLAPR